MAAKSSMKDMTNGNPTKLILGFAIPMLLGTLFQQFYSMVDTIIVGRFLGVDALAGVGSTGAINFMVNGFVIGVTAGFAIPVAQRFGAQDFTGLRKYVAQIIYLTVAISVLMTVVIGALTKSILIGTNTPASIFDYAFDYIFIIFLGTPAIFLYNITASIIRSLGDAKTPVYFLIFAALLNILLDYISIGLMGLGVEGPAYATVISQGLSGVLCLVYMVYKFPVLHFETGELKPDGEKVLTLLGMGVPMGLQYSITAIGSVILQTAVNGLGAIALAAITAGQRISNFVCCVFDSLGATMATYAGQNVGALRFDRIREGVRSATIQGAIYSVLICVILIFFGGEIPKLFVDAGETEVITNAHLFLVCNAAFYIPLTIVNVWRFTIQGMGFSGLAILAGVCEMVARGLVGFVFVPWLGYIASCFASPLAWIFADAFLIPCFYHCLKKLKKQYLTSA